MDIESLPNGQLVIPGGITRQVVTPGQPEHYPDDAYPAIIRDQRHVYGQPFPDSQRVWNYWQERLGERQPVHDARQLEPFIYRSTWVALCPDCESVIPAWDQNPYVLCMTCAHRYNVRWQSPKLRAQVVRVLSVRHPRERNWLAGETVARLETENTFYPQIVATHARQCPGIVTPTQYLSEHF